MTKIQQMLAIGAALLAGAGMASAVPALAQGKAAAPGWTPAGGTSGAAFFVNSDKTRVAACYIAAGNIPTVRCTPSISLPTS